MSKNNKLLLILFLTCVLVVILLIPSKRDDLYSNQTTTLQLNQRTKQDGCVVYNALPDPQCTPGAVFATPKERICVSGYSGTVRYVPESLKEKVYKAYGITSHETGEYEIDHFISLALGGSNDISNLWPEAAEPRPGFHEKDRVENFLLKEMCEGRITLAQAQLYVSWKWQEVQAYVQNPNPMRDLFEFVQGLFE